MPNRRLCDGITTRAEANRRLRAEQHSSIAERHESLAAEHMRIACEHRRLASLDQSPYVGMSNEDCPAVMSGKPTDFVSVRLGLVAQGGDVSAHKQLRALALGHPAPQPEPGKFVRIINELGRNYRSWGGCFPEVV